MKKKQQLYIVRKFVIADSAFSALKKEKNTPVHDVFIEEVSQKKMIENITDTDKERMGF